MRYKTNRIKINKYLVTTAMISENEKTYEQTNEPNLT